MATMDDVVSKYVQLRDAKAKLVAGLREKTAVIDAALDRCEAAMLSELTSLGAESVRTEAGTAYKSTKTFVSVADWDATLAYIRDNELWPMLKKDVAKSVVETFKEEHNDLPPGLNWREEITINVRRA